MERTIGKEGKLCCCCRRRIGLDWIVVAKIRNISPYLLICTVLL